MAMRVAGFGVMNLRATQSYTDRAELLHNFNNSQSNCEVLGNNIRLARLGLNLHHSCRRSMLLVYPWNANVVLQIFGCLMWIGQQSEMIWITFTMPDTLYDKFEVTVRGRYAMQLADKATVGNVKGPWGNDAVMFKIIRVLFGHPFSRFFFHHEQDGCS
ncbi:hypothetical protein PG991_009200 [Apiospora marii]|uniref:Uncharacterized protein n=1 Tax=Apiospora marii TaxID=335849 RepID=A0ABR1RJZ7_9PEZI